MNMKKLMKSAAVFLAVVLCITGCGSQLASGDAKYSHEEAVENLARLIKNDKVDVIHDYVDAADLDLNYFVATDLAALLPDFELTHLPVVDAPTGSRYITIFSSTEKATDNETDRWLIDLAQQFNSTNTNGYGVCLYGVASGEAYDYIKSGKYVPDVYTPSSTLWGDGLGLTAHTERLAGNVAGIVTKKDSPKTVDQLIAAIENESFKFGYTNPLSSSTGLNFLLTYLQLRGADTFEGFQRKIPFVSYTTGQMRDAAIKGVLDGFVYEAQVYESGTGQTAKDLRNEYVFTPFGIRHDNPVYILNDSVSDIAEDFIQFCLTNEAQQAATKLGFNRYDDYKGTPLNGGTLEKDRELFKEKKSGGQEIASVFVCDISGSMDGTPIAQLRSSLLESAKHIGENNAIGMITYSDNVNTVLPIARYDTEQHMKFIGAIENLYVHGSTATNSAINTALMMLLDYKKANPDTILKVFVLTDGETNKGWEFKSCKDVWQSLEIPIYCIGYNGATGDLAQIAGLTEAANIAVTEVNVLYALSNFFKAQM